MDMQRLFDMRDAVLTSDTDLAIMGAGGKEEGEPGHLFRLFVGWVPKNYTEKDLTPLFSKYGVVKDIIVLKDKVTGSPRGCAFVSFATKAEAILAIRNLDRQVQLAGALCPLEVRFAKSHQYIQAGSGPEDNRQLFFTNAPTELTEEEISAFFSQFGAVEEVNLFRERKTGNSKGCGFVTMQSRDQAMRAINAMEDKSGEPSGASTSLQVKWADPDLQHKKKKALEESNADNRMLFFAKVLRSATEEEVKALFNKFGKVYDVNLFRAFQGAPTTKGCGLVTMGTHEEAVAAIDALDNKFTWEGMESPMVVKWMDAALQRRRREQHLAALRSGLMPGMPGVGGWPGPEAQWMAPALQQLSAMPGNVRMGGGYGGPGAGPSGQEADGVETPPAGCQADAIKLFVGNIPKACTEEQLMPFFETIGKVVELVIVRDKATHESKGSAFVWYATRSQAERAILQFNLRHVLPDPSGEQDRPLVVRKAKARAKVMGAPQMHMHPAMSMLTGGPGMGMPQQAYYTTGPGGKLQAGSISIATGLEGLPSQAISMQAGMGGYAQLSNAAAGGYRMQPVTTAQLVSIQGAPTVQEAGLYEAYGSGAGYAAAAPGAGAMDGLGMDYMQAAAASQQAGQLEQLGQMALSLPLNQNQLATVNNHLFSVQTMSGASLHISPGAPGLFHLVISGGKAQVETAKNLVTTVLGQMMM